MTKSSINDIFDKTSFLHGANAVYIEQMFERFQNNPADIPDDWRTFFSGITDNLNQQNILRASWASQNVETNNEEDTLENINESEIKIESQILNKDNIVTSEVFKEQVFDSIRAIRLIRAYRVNGHLASNLDPLNLKEIKTYSELDYRNYGFKENDLDKEIFIDGSLGLNFAKLRNIIVITGKDHVKINKLLKKFRVQVIKNLNYNEGINSSISLGIKKLPRNSLSTMICLADMPLLKSEDYNSMVQFEEKFKNKSKIKNKNNVLLVLAWNFYDDIKKNNLNLSDNFVNIKELETSN